MKTLTIDVEKIAAIPRSEVRHKFYGWLANQFDGITILECGTCMGDSTQSWANNPNNIVLSYDIEMPSRKKAAALPNVFYKIQDCNEINPSWFSKVDIIFLDISHNGDDEEKFLERIEPYFKGILVMDDVNCPNRWPKLNRLFVDMKRKHHFLPKEIGATRGTGVIAYGDWTIDIKGGTE